MRRRGFVFVSAFVVLSGCHSAAPVLPTTPLPALTPIVPEKNAEAPTPAEETDERSFAQRAYDRIARGDLAGAVADYQRARVELDADGLVDEQPSLRGAIGLLRLDAERRQRASGEIVTEVDCTVFEKHGADALDAYRAWFASTRDTYAFEIKHQCFDTTLAKVAPIAASRARTAKDRIVASMLTEIPIPDGTMYQGMALGSADAVVDVLLAPEAVKTSDGNAKLAAAAKRHPKLQKAIARFQKVRDADAPVLAGGVCAILEARGHATTRTQCEDIAVSASSYAMARWIDATQEGP